MPTEIAYLNGQFMPLQEARVPVLDRGFLFADGVYEMLPAYGGHLFGLPPHLQRLQRSLDGIRLANPFSESEWQGILHELTRRAGTHDQSIYLQVTRGAAEKRAHAFPQGVRPTVFAMSTPLQTMPAEQRLRGVKLVTHEDIRWRYRHLKTIGLLGNVLMLQHAQEQGGHEALLVCDGMVTEGASSNVFIVKQGSLLTPPQSEYLLPGITREIVLALAHKYGMPCAEQTLPLREVLTADEVWITSSGRELVPVVQIDDQRIATGQVGPLWRRMWDHFETLKTELRAGRGIF